MKLNILNKKLAELFNGEVHAREDDFSIILEGELDSYEDILKACFFAADKKSGKHVVNDIHLKGAKEIEVHKPSIRDDSLEGSHPDVLVIGGGISGASILRELSRYKLDLLLVDKEADLANHASSRNDGEIHPGVDLKKGTLKQSLVVRGNRMYDQISKELNVPFRRIGQYAAFCEWWMFLPMALIVLERKYICGVDDTRLVSWKHLRKVDSRFNPDFRWAIYNPMSGVISPYELTIAYGENAVQNGAKVSLNTMVESMDLKDGRITAVHTNRGTIYPKLVINAAGCFADDIAEMANDRYYSIHPRKGTILIADKKANYLINTISSIQKVKKNKTRSKGGGILRTVHDNLLLGPDAFEVREKEDFSTDRSSVDAIVSKQSETVVGLKRSDLITYFAGCRAATFEEDFIIEKGKRCSNMIHVAGIQSPGITTAPAVSEDVSKLAVSMLENVELNKNFNPNRPSIPKINEMSFEERDSYIKKNPDYGKIICRCEEISKGEIIDALNSPIKVATVDGIKRRLRPGMGRCQGTFCMPLVMKIIAEHEGIEMKDVCKSDSSTKIGVRNKGEDE